MLWVKSFERITKSVFIELYKRNKTQPLTKTSASSQPCAFGIFQIYSRFLILHTWKFVTFFFFHRCNNSHTCFCFNAYPEIRLKCKWHSACKKQWNTTAKRKPSVHNYQTKQFANRNGKRNILERAMRSGAMKFK